MKKVLVTGACGYLGARLSLYLAESGYSVTAFDSYNPSTHIQWISLMDDVIIGDIRDELTISNLVEKRFDIAVHLISLDHYKSEADPEYVSSINVLPTWNMLDKLTKNGLEKFIYFSTVHVYGNLPRKIISEDLKTNPSSAYGLTHLLSENLCNYYHENTKTDCINVRLSNSYGSPTFKENNCWRLVINDFCKAAYEKNKIIINSDGSPQKDFIHGDDVVKAIDILITAKISDRNNVYHIASGKSLTILELAHIVKEVYSKRYNIDVDIILQDNSISKKLKIFDDIERYSFSTKKLDKLGYKINTELHSGIDEIFQYLESFS
jgi:nucleoside-diphosphate-sugar epimerase